MRAPSLLRTRVALLAGLGTRSLAAGAVRTVPVYQLDSFTSRVFGGNPAAVCPMEEWLPADVMQAIACENALSETAFTVPTDKPDCDFELRWFTPTVEVDLCERQRYRPSRLGHCATRAADARPTRPFAGGHATLATAHVILEELEPKRTQVAFHTRSGRLLVQRAASGGLTLDFPLWPASATSCEPPAALVEAVGPGVVSAYSIPELHGAMLPALHMNPSARPSFCAPPCARPRASG